MPRPLGSEKTSVQPMHEHTLKVIDFAVGQHAAQCAPDTHDLPTHLFSTPLILKDAVAFNDRFPEVVQDLTNRTAAQLMAKSRAAKMHSPKGVANDAEELKNRAQEDTDKLLGAARGVVPRDIADTASGLGTVLRNSTGMVRVFAAVDGRVPHNRESNNDWLLRYLAARPAHYMSFDDEAQKVRFSDAGKDFLRPYLAPEVGCPILNHSVEFSGERMNLFSVGAAWLTENHIQRRVADRPKGFKDILRFVARDLVGAAQK